VTFSQAVRYMMDQCDQHGLHFEVLEDFMIQCNALYINNELLCRDGQPQETPDYTAMASAALLEWDI